MYKLFTDKAETFECDIKIEGASLTNSTARLIIETEDLALLFKGNINASGKCTIPVKKLKGLLGESAKGNIKLEVIDTYFTPWESQFEVDTSKKITVEVKSQQTPVITEETKPTIKVENIKEEISLSEKDHVINLLKLLIKEEINFKNISYKRNTLNNIVATYMEENPIQEETKPTIMEGVIKGLLKKTK